jgi:hypothetical protein
MVVGAAALVIWEEPIQTQDLDIAVPVSSDEEYAKVWSSVRKAGDELWRQDRWGIVVKGLPVQVVPVDIDSVYIDAFKHAVIRTIEGLRVKVCTKEHLVVMKAKAFRSKDRDHLARLLEGGIDRRRLREILKRLDGDGKIAGNIQKVGQGDYP